MIPLPSQCNTLVQGLSIADITPQQILAAGEPIFLDITTSSDISSINRLIQSYARIHAPTYGQPIPRSGLNSSVVGAGNLLEPSSTEIRKVMTIDVTNAGAAPITGSISMGSSQLIQFAIEPANTSPIPIQFPVTIDAGLYLSVAVSSGTASDLTTSCASVLLIQ